MKKIMFLLTVIVILVACTKDEEAINDGTSDSYVCLVTQSVSCNPPQCGVNRTSSYTITVANVSNRNAKKFESDLTNISTLTTSVGIITIKNVCTLIKTE